MRKVSDIADENYEVETSENQSSNNYGDFDNSSPEYAKEYANSG